VYTFSVLKGAPYAFIKFHLLIKKKKKKTGNIAGKTYEFELTLRSKNRTALGSCKRNIQNKQKALGLESTHKFHFLLFLLHFPGNQADN
jgi:hypothetical protein